MIFGEKRRDLYVLTASYSHSVMGMVGDLNFKNLGIKLIRYEFRYGSGLIASVEDQFTINITLFLV